MAASAAALSGISTKPNPRDRPVSRSVIILMVSTGHHTAEELADVLIRGSVRNIVTKCSRKYPCESREESPGHPNSMQKQQLQEHDAVEKRRASLADIRKVLWLRRTEN